MATTKIWAVKSNVGYVINYAEDKNKTGNPQFTKSELQSLTDVMDYAMNDYKTEKRHFVTGINCIPVCAREQMQRVKEQFGKTDKILAWHGYQSFAPNEVDAKTAHEIGVKLAKELWSDFQVIVATHLNTNCFHTHFVLNSVSYKTGKKFYGNRETYRKMREVSDRLCREYGLSVIENQSPSKSKSYTEIQAERENQRTWRSVIREDVDKAVAKSISFQAFLRNIQSMGYEVKIGKHIAIRPKGKERFVRLRSLGEDYTEQAIKEHILSRLETEKPQKPKEIKKAKFKGSFTLCRKMTWNSLRALYYYYLHKLRKAKENPNDLHLIREDLILLDKLSKQAKFLNKHKIDSKEDLQNYKESVQSQISVLSDEREEYRKLKRHKYYSSVEKTEFAYKTKALSSEIRALQKEVKLCDEIAERSEILKEKIDRTREIQRENIKQKRACTTKDVNFLNNKIIL